MCVSCVCLYIYENESVRKEVVSALLIYMCKWIEKKKEMETNKQTKKLWWQIKFLLAVASTAKKEINNNQREGEKEKDGKT